MRDSTYYYDCIGKTFCNMLYQEAIKYKIEKGKQLRDKLEILISKLHYNQSYELRVRLDKVEKAISFNKGLLDECKND